MQIAIMTFDGFNEIDSFVAFGMLNRLHMHGWRAHIVSPSAQVTSKSGVVITAQQPLEFANEADVVLFGSGSQSRHIAADASLRARVQLDSTRQLLGAQCSGALLLAQWGYLGSAPASTDFGTKPALEATGVRVVPQSFHASGNVATAGGCLSSQYLATWVMAKLASPQLVREALAYSVPVGNLDAYTQDLLDTVAPFL